jgi:hypothetical protein
MLNPPTPTGNPQVKAWNAHSLESIKAKNEAAGMFWFRPDTCQFFQSVNESYLGQGVFVTSEKSGFGSDQKRRFSVRVCDTEGNVHTFGNFLGYHSRRSACLMARRLAVALGEGKEVMDSLGNTFAAASV